MPRTAQTGRASSVSEPRGGGGWLRGLIVVLVVACLLAAAAYWAIHKLTNLSIFHPSGCTATAAAGSTDLDLDQAKYASTIAAVGVSLKVPPFGIQVAEATAMQESKLHNVGYGDRDSLGLFQQRPSCGWGSAAQITNPAYAANAFLSALRSHESADPDWASKPLWATAQAVQNSGFPYAYAKWEAQAAQLVQRIASHMV